MRLFHRKAVSEEMEELERVSQGEAEIDGNSEEKTYDFTDSALECFGWKNVKTDKWLIKCAKVWYCIASFSWFLLGALTFAPVIFIRNKLKPIVKDDKICFIVSVAIYLAFVAVLLFFVFTTRANNIKEIA